MFLLALFLHDSSHSMILLPTLFLFSFSMDAFSHKEGEGEKQLFAFHRI